MWRALGGGLETSGHGPLVYSAAVELNPPVVRPKLQGLTVARAAGALFTQTRQAQRFRGSKRRRALLSVVQTVRRRSSARRHADLPMRADVAHAKHQRADKYRKARGIRAPVEEDCAT